jgi:uncharacterized membrane protein YfcA
MTIAFALTLLGLGLGGAFVAGLLGVGGAMVMIPLLLYVPPLLEVGRLSVKAVAGITMVQVVAATLSAVIAHQRHQAVNTRIAWTGGIAMSSSSLLGAVGSYYIYDRWLLIAFAIMVTGAGVLMLTSERLSPASRPVPERYSVPRTMLVCSGVGLLTGLVGAGGAFLLVPLLFVIVRLPLRVTIGTSLAIAAAAAAAGVIGKAATGQIPYAPALVVAAGALPGGHLGAAVSRRLTNDQLRLAFTIVIGLVAAGVWWNIFTY